MIALCLLSADFIGKIDKHSLSQQTLMELCIEGITNKEIICGSQKNPLDISEWTKVRFSPNGDVLRIYWFSMALGGSVALKWLPLTLTDAILSGNRLTGTADLTCLPDTLEVLSLSDNQFEGSVNLTRLPSRLRQLFLYTNNFCRKTDFNQLPKSLLELDIDETQLEGEIFAFEGRLSTRKSKVKDMRSASDGYTIEEVSEGKRPRCFVRIQKTNNCLV